MKPGKLLTTTSGAILLMAAILLIVLIGMAALAIDLGQLYIAKQRAQNVCDAAALAAIRHIDPARLGVTRPIAIEAAIDCALANNESGYWKVFETGTQVEGVSVSFPADDSVRTDADVPIDYAFAGIFGLKSGKAHAHAVARLMIVRSMSVDFIPLGVCQSVAQNLEFGEPTILKSDSWRKQGNTDSFIGPGNFAPLVLPGDKKGGKDYENRLSGAKDDPVTLSIGDELETKPGNMVGPTDKGVSDRIAGDEVYTGTGGESAWDEWLRDYQTEGNTSFASSPRLVICPIIADPDPPLNGRSGTVTVVGFAAFFIDTETIGDLGGAKYVQIGAYFVGAVYSPEEINATWWMGPSGGSSGTVVGARLVE